MKANHIAANGIFNTVKDRCERMRGNLIASQRLAASLIQLKERCEKISGGKLNKWAGEGEGSIF